MLIIIKKMERRRALQAIVFFSIAGNALVSCKNKYAAVKSIGLKNIKPSDSQLDLIDDLSKNIFPVTPFSQFEGHTALPFVLTTVDGIYTKEERDKYVNGIKAFDDLANKTFQNGFVDLGPEQKLSMLKKISASVETSDAKYFFEVTRQQTIHYFTHTENYMRGVQKYEMAPGRFKGCLPIDQIQSKKL